MRTDREKWHEHCMKIYNYHPLFTDSLRTNGAGEINRVNFLLNMFRDQERGSLCDVGSQEGYIAHQLHLMGFDVTAVDSCPRFVSEGRLRYPEVNFMNGFFEDQDFNNQFDYVLCSETLEHVCNPDEFMMAILKSLKAGGALICSVPLPAFGEYITHHKTWGKREFPEFINRYLTVVEKFHHGNWNYVVATKGIVRDISMDEMLTVMEAIN